MEEVKKFRSPQFPFIPLEKAVARAIAFEADYRSHAARMANAVKLWGYGDKSSGGIQTVAALSAYGLLEDEGSLEARKLRLTPLALTIMKDARPGAAAKALKTAALKPKVIAELWADWGAQRPPDAECISILILEKQFSEDAAQRLLGIYDATIQYAGLADGDKSEDNNGIETESTLDSDEDKNVQGKVIQITPKTGGLQAAGKVPIMENERVLYDYKMGPDRGFKIIVTGEVDQALANALEAFAKFQVSIAPPVGSTASNDETKPQ